MKLWVFGGICGSERPRGEFTGGGSVGSDSRASGSRHFPVIHDEARTLSASARAFIDLLEAKRIERHILGLPGASPGARE